MQPEEIKYVQTEEMYFLVQLKRILLIQIFAEYRLEKESGPAHAKMYTVRLHLGNKEYVGTERSIKLAQHAAAQVALNDHRSLSLTNNYDQDISQINGKIYC